MTENSNKQKEVDTVRYKFQIEYSGCDDELDVNRDRR